MLINGWMNNKNKHIHMMEPSPAVCYNRKELQKDYAKWKKSIHMMEPSAAVCYNREELQKDYAKWKKSGIKDDTL